jgi:hypothetical protein
LFAVFADTFSKETFKRKGIALKKPTTILKEINNEIPQVKKIFISIFTTIFLRHKC